MMKKYIPCIEIPCGLIGGSLQYRIINEITCGRYNPGTQVLHPELPGEELHYIGY
jgi:hypothetical protein